MRQLRKLKRRQILLLSLRRGSANVPTFLGSQKMVRKGKETEVKTVNMLQ